MKGRGLEIKPLALLESPAAVTSGDPEIQLLIYCPTLSVPCPRGDSPGGRLRVEAEPHFDATAVYLCNTAHGLPAECVSGWVAT